jgi:hypothetical protein
MAGKAKPNAELDFLEAVEAGEVVSQNALAKQVSLSVGLVNAVLRRMAQKGYVKIRSAPFKRYAYYLTPHGFVEKARLVAEYLDVSLSFFRRARGEYGDLLVAAQKAGVRRIAFAGDGELVEIALLAAIELDVEVVGVLNRDTNLDRIGRLRVARTPEELGPVDAIVVVASRRPQATYDALRLHYDDAAVLAPKFLRVTRMAEPPAKAEIAA